MERRVRFSRRPLIRIRGLLTQDGVTEPNRLHATRSKTAAARIGHSPRHAWRRNEERSCVSFEKGREISCRWSDGSVGEEKAKKIGRGPRSSARNRTARKLTEIAKIIDSGNCAGDRSDPSTEAKCGAAHELSHSATLPSLYSQEKTPAGQERRGTLKGNI